MVVLSGWWGACNGDIDRHYPWCGDGGVAVAYILFLVVGVCFVTALWLGPVLHSARGTKRTFMVLYLASLTTLVTCLTVAFFTTSATTALRRLIVTLGALVPFACRMGVFVAHSKRPINTRVTVWAWAGVLLPMLAGHAVWTRTDDGGPWSAVVLYLTVAAPVTSTAWLLLSFVDALHRARAVLHFAVGFFFPLGVCVPLAASSDVSVLARVLLLVLAGAMLLGTAVSASVGAAARRRAAAAAAAAAGVEDTDVEAVAEEPTASTLGAFGSQRGVRQVATLLLSHVVMFPSRLGFKLQSLVLIACSIALMTTLFTWDLYRNRAGVVAGAALVAPLVFYGGTWAIQHKRHMVKAGTAAVAVEVLLVLLLVVLPIDSNSKLHLALLTAALLLGAAPVAWLAVFLSPRLYFMFDGGAVRAIASSLCCVAVFVPLGCALPIVLAADRLRDSQADRHLASVMGLAVVLAVGATAILLNRQFKLAALDKLRKLSAHFLKQDLLQAGVFCPAGVALAMFDAHWNLVRVGGLCR